MKHRLWIGLRAEALLDGYWQNRPSEAVKEEIVADWIAALEAFTPEEIRDACREWVNANPRQKPNQGGVRQIILAKRALAVAKAKRPEPEPFTALSVPSEERKRAAERILSEVFRNKEI